MVLPPEEGEWTVRSCWSNYYEYPLAAAWYFIDRSYTCTENEYNRRRYVEWLDSQAMHPFYLNGDLQKQETIKLNSRPIKRWNRYNLEFYLDCIETVLGARAQIMRSRGEL